MRHPLDVCVSRAYHERNLFRDGHLEGLLIGADQGAQLEALLAAGTPTPGGLFGDGDLLPLLLDDWIRHNEPFLELAAELPERFTLVRYKDHEGQPAIGRAAVRVPGAAAVAGRPRRRAGGHELRRPRRACRRQEDAGAFLRKGVIGDHVQHVSEDQRARARVHLGELPALFGYDV